jgi:DNA polymerase
MQDDALFKEAVDDTRALVKQSAGRRGAMVVSPEVAAMLEQLDAVPAAPDAPPDPATVGELAELERIVSRCTLCSLSETRTQTVFGDGNSQADLVFVGEAPGADEDAQGKPFVGRAGQLLTDIIEKGMKVRRRQVYICNVLKCRPPNNRDPRPDEKELCEPYLVKQLELIRPKVICALGTHAAQTLLKTDTPIGRLRGNWHFYHGIPLRATYHPAYLLRNPGDKRKTWDDIQTVMRVLAGEERPEPPNS